MGKSACVLVFVFIAIKMLFMAPKLYTGVTFTTGDKIIVETDENQTVSVCVTMTPPAGGLDRNAVVTYLEAEAESMWSIRIILIYTVYTL